MISSCICRLTGNSSDHCTRTRHASSEKLQQQQQYHFHISRCKDTDAPNRIPMNTSHMNFCAQLTCVHEKKNQKKKTKGTLWSTLLCTVG